MLTKQQMPEAVDGLITEAERLHEEFLTVFLPWSAEFASWVKACETTIEAVFGSASNALSSFKGIYIPTATAVAICGRCGEAQGAADLV
ncbi:MAG: hypothetical protein IH939_12650 [Acidobacteria bacterium]|nr:hypothetical protein [Acidobacteriota bacterium]